MRKSNFPLTAADVAEFYYGLQPDQRPYKKVLDLLSKKHASIKISKAAEQKLGRLLDNAEEFGLVRHVVIRSLDDGYLPLLPGMEDRVRLKYNLRDVTVVDARSLRMAASKEKREWSGHDDDRLHSHLGRWAGRILTSLIRSGDVLGTGGGRGPYWTAQNCSVPKTTVVRKVVSLTGSIAATTWSEAVVSSTYSPKNIDADRVASILRGNLDPKDDYEHLSAGVGTRETAPAAAEVNIAVVGIGALAGGHRLRHLDKLQNFGRQNSAKLRGLVKRLNSEADELETILRQKKKRDCHAVGDVCNWYFLLDWIEQIVRKSEISKINTIIEQLNKEFINTAPSNLEAICAKGTVLAVAGGPHKVDAIAHVLRNGGINGPLVSHLVTDDETANLLLDDGMLEDD